ncbi:MAG TPA: Rne/Rng family ribonuclease [Candidatus Tectomicrobia bacterium]
MIEIIVNASQRETRVALLENTAVAELFIERHHDYGIVGNIYKGCVTKILPGIQAAFVDIGLKKSGFLYVADLIGGHAGMPEQAQAQALEIQAASHASIPLAPPLLPTPHLRIEECVEEGQELLVQVVKEPLGTKGCRVTAAITLPGRYLVLMPSVPHIGVSRRITSVSEKERLHQLASALLPAGMGCIVRTRSTGATGEELQADGQFLTTLWHDVQQKAALASAPSLVHQELDLLLRTLRDFLTEDVERCLIDHAETYTRAQEFVRTYFPPHTTQIGLYQDTRPIFEAFDIERQIEHALRPKIWLKSGGYITIEQTEALVAIDVNTGRFVGVRNPAETILTTNLEAVDEVVRQLRLRNLGGLIIIDFIDMEDATHRDQVVQALEARLQPDRARTKVLSISDFGLVEMTRQRTRASLSHVLCEPCHCCGGRGVIETAATVCSKVFREIQRVALAAPYTRKVVVHVHPVVADWLHHEERAYVSELEQNLRISLTIQANDHLRQGQFDVLSF